MGAAARCEGGAARVGVLENTPHPSNSQQEVKIDAAGVLLLQYHLYKPLFLTSARCGAPINSTKFQFSPNTHVSGELKSIFLKVPKSNFNYLH